MTHRLWKILSSLAIILVLVSAIVYLIQPDPPRQRSQPPPAPAKPEGRYEVTVTQVEMGDPNDLLLRWTVTARVDRVVQGTAPSEPLRISIHSPSLSGVTPGGRYEIEYLEVPEGPSVLEWKPIVGR